jgi:uncharacterized membrane protein
VPPKATPERVSAFSDGVFAILITVLVLELCPPEQPTFKALVQLWPTWISYAVSYLFIATVWANHHYLLRYASAATPSLLWFNFGHLFSMFRRPFRSALPRPLEGRKQDDGAAPDPPQAPLVAAPPVLLGRG